MPYALTVFVTPPSGAPNDDVPLFRFFTPDEEIGTCATVRMHVVFPAAVLGVFHCGPYNYNFHCQGVIAACTALRHIGRLDPGRHRVATRKGIVQVTVSADDEHILTKLQ